MSTCELCDMREPLAEIIKALDKLNGIARLRAHDVDAHIAAAFDYLERADWILETHEMDCPVPKWDGPDTVEEARL